MGYLALRLYRWLFWLSVALFRFRPERVRVATVRNGASRFVTVRYGACVRFLPLFAAICRKAGLGRSSLVKFSPAVSFFQKNLGESSCNYLQLSTCICNSCLQLPAIDYLYRIEKVYNYLLHFPAYRGIVYMLLVAVPLREPFLL